MNEIKYRDEYFDFSKCGGILGLCGFFLVSGKIKKISCIIYIFIIINKIEKCWE